MSDLGRKMALKIGEATFLKATGKGVANAEKNRPYFGKTIDDLEIPGKNEAAIVVVGGPSLHRKDTATKIMASQFKGAVVVADGALGYCLRNGLIPDYVVCLDPHPHRIVRWFGDHELNNRPKDDYFSRQDFDPEYWKDEVAHNRRLLELVNRHGQGMKAILSTSVDTSVTKRCLESGMDIYWWNPLYDDYEKPDSISEKLVTDTGIPCMVTGGNVGTAAWIFTHAVLNVKNVALAGMDLGYAPETPLFRTQYYYEICDLLGKDRALEAYIQIHNPFLNETWFTDPTFYWFKEVILDLAKDANCTTYNCTEGGILFEPPIVWAPLQEFLSRFNRQEINNG